MFKSIDGGANWTSFSNGLPSRADQCAGRRSNDHDDRLRWNRGRGRQEHGRRGLERSERWPAGFPGPGLAADPLTPTTLYASVWGGSTYKSTSGGQTWTALTTLPNKNVEVLVVNPDDAANGVCGDVERRGVQERGRGATWNVVNTGLTTLNVNALAIDPKSPNTIYAGVYNTGATTGGVFKSTDGGASWNPVNTGLTSLDVRALAIDRVTPATLYAGMYGGVFKSTNGGGSWAVKSTSLTNLNVNALVINPLSPATLYAGTNGGRVFKSTDGGDNWGWPPRA